MQFILKLTTGGEVIFDGPPGPLAPVYYGGPPPETGRWRVDPVRFEDFCAARLAKVDVGDSIDTFCFGLEIAELQGWGDTFAATRQYISHRPKMKALVSVGQIEWADVKHLGVERQMDVLWSALVSSVERVAAMKRKPRNFDAHALSTAVRVLQASCDPLAFAITPR